MGFFLAAVVANRGRPLYIIRLPEITRRQQKILTFAITKANTDFDADSNTDTSTT